MNNIQAAWTVRESTRDEIEMVYARKPKAILIMDCAYLESERLREIKERQAFENKNAELRQQVELLKSKLRTLGMANGKLTEAITLLRDGMMQ